MINCGENFEIVPAPDPAGSESKIPVPFPSMNGVPV